MAQVPQNYANHARFVPMFHAGVLVPFAANFFWTAYRLTRNVSGDSVMAFVMAIALMLLAFAVRVQVLTVQDRVIRLEMRLRLRDVLPADLARADRRPDRAAARRPALRERRSAAGAGARGVERTVDRGKSDQAEGRRLAGGLFESVRNVGFRIEDVELNFGIPIHHSKFTIPSS